MIDHWHDIRVDLEVDHGRAIDIIELEAIDLAHLVDVAVRALSANARAVYRRATAQIEAVKDWRLNAQPAAYAALGTRMATERDRLALWIVRQGADDRLIATCLEMLGYHL